jgi:hypothetical protein
MTVEPLPEKVDRWLASVGNKLESRGLKLFVPAEHAPDAEQREYLSRREARLKQFLGMATESDVGAAVGHMALALAFPASESAVEADARLAVYVEALAGKVSAWALQVAYLSFIDGTRGDGKWMPRPGELAKVANEVMQPLRAERAKILKALSAEVLPAIDKPKADQAGDVVASGVREMSAATKASLEAFRHEAAITRAMQAGGKEPEKIPTKDDAIAWLANEQANPRPLPRLSSEALKR